MMGIKEYNDQKKNKIIMGKKKKVSSSFEAS